MVTAAQAKRLRGFGLRALHIREMDPEIVSTVIDLNRNGFHTTESCAGHKGGPGDGLGNIFFYPFPKGVEYRRALAIMTRRGLRNLRAKHAYSAVVFSGIGKSWGR